jgi:uncharacterized protein with ATP-grasp and redox domains
MSLPVDSSCMLCYLKKHLDLARSLGDDATTDAFMRELTQQFLDLPRHLPSPALAAGTNELLRRYYGLEPDRFRAEKEASNAFVVARMEDLRNRVRSAEDPVLAALQFAILGNYIIGIQKLTVGFFSQNFPHRAFSASRHSHKHHIQHFSTETGKYGVYCCVGYLFSRKNFTCGFCLGNQHQKSV